MTPKPSKAPRFLWHCVKVGYAFTPANEPDDCDPMIPTTSEYAAKYGISGAELLRWVAIGKEDPETINRNASKAALSGPVIRPVAGYKRTARDADKIYQPLKVPNLLRKLAAARISQEGIIEFADRYGLLVRGQEMRYSQWAVAIRWARVAVLCRDLIDRSLSPADAKALVRDAAKARHVLVEKETKRTLAFRVKVPEAPPEAHALTGGRLSGFWVRRMLIDADGLTEDSRTHLDRLLFDAANSVLALRCMPLAKRGEITLTPRDLLGAIWQQFVTGSVLGEVADHCRACGKPIRYREGQADTEKDKLRKGARVCNNVCQQRLQRKKQRDAKRLREAGVSIASIAAELDTEPESVERWLKPRRTSRPA